MTSRVLGIFGVMTVLLGVALVMIIWELDVSNKQEVVFGCGVMDSDFPKVYPAIDFDNSDREGQRLFEENCKACHGIDKASVGPALRHIGKERERQWIYDVVRNPDALKDDSLYQSILKETPLRMTKFPDLTDEEIDQIVEYVSQP